MYVAVPNNSVMIYQSAIYGTAILPITNVPPPLVSVGKLKIYGYISAINSKFITGSVA